MTPRTTNGPRKNSRNFTVINVVQFTDDEDVGFAIVEQSQENWTFLESGRSQKTFETIRELGAGGCGTVS